MATTIRRGRYYWRPIRELAHAHTAWLVVGFLVGLIGSFVSVRLFPSVPSQMTLPTIRTALVGDFTSSALPPSIQQLVSRGLTQLDDEGLPKPALSLSWQATDSGRTYEFILNPLYVWHNGKPVDAGDVNYNIRDVTFSVKDKTTLRASLKEPFSPFLSLVAKPLFQSGLRGFGPYKVDTIRLKGDSVQYLKLTSAGAERLPVREYRFYKTEAQAITAFKLGDIDRIDELTNADDLKAISQGQKKETVRYDRVVALYFNTGDPFVSEKSIRQALAYAVPTFPEERARSPISIKSWGYTDEVRLYDFDAAQAKKLLTKAGVATRSATLTLTTFPAYVDVAQAIAKSWTSLGVATLVKVETSVTSGFQVLLGAQNIPPDPDQYPLWHQTQKQTNLTGYANVKIDKLLEDGRRELDIEKRKKIYADFAKRLVEDAPAVFLYYPKTYTISRR